ncbi:MAG: hypothetical protein ACX93U_03150 [Salipiger thiooxidans]
MPSRTKRCAALAPPRSGRWSTNLPAFDALDPERRYLRWEVRLYGTVAEDALRDDFLFHDKVAELAAVTAAPAVEAARPTPRA